MFNFPQGVCWECKENITASCNGQNFLPFCNASRQHLLLYNNQDRVTFCNEPIFTVPFDFRVFISTNPENNWKQILDSLNSFKNPKKNILKSFLKRIVKTTFGKKVVLCQNWNPQPPLSERIQLNHYGNTSRNCWGKMISPVLKSWKMSGTQSNKKRGKNKPFQLLFISFFRSKNPSKTGFLKQF